MEWPGIVSWVASMRYCVHVNGILFMRPLSSSSFSKVVPAVRRGFSRRLGRGGSFARTEEVGAPAVFAASWLLATPRVCYYSLSIRERGRADVNLESTAALVGIVRDVLLIFILLFVGVALYVVYRRLSSVLESVDGTLKSAREVTDAISERFSESTSSGGGFISGLGKILSFIRRVFARNDDRDSS